MTLKSTSKDPIQLFYSYSHADEKLRLELEKHLSVLSRQAVIAGWHDRNIGAGFEWSGEIDKHLNTAAIIVLLVSADFLASDYCYGIEMIRAMERHERGESRVVPIILRPCDWATAPFGKLQALPKDAKPITSWEDRDEAFSNVARGIRLICEEIRVSSYKATDARSVTSLDSFELFEVFKPSGVPTVTFVEPDNFALLKLALAQPGRGVVIEGPSGIGKTTALRKAMDQLEPIDQLANMEILSARKPDDVRRMGYVRDWHQGLIALDDFHRLNESLREDLIDYLKYLADYEVNDRKLVIVGIPQTGRKLVELSFDVATRIEICKLGKVEDSTVLRMIGKGEKALNVIFDRKTDITRAAAGSLNIAQLLCYQVAAQLGINRTQITTLQVHSDLEDAISKVVGQMSLKFGEIIRTFASLGGPQDRTSIELLQELTNTEDGFLPLYPLKDTRPELADGIDNFLARNYMAILYTKFPTSKNHLLLDESTPALVIDDPQLTFYISQTPANLLVKSTGKKEERIRSGVFICYSHADLRWLKRLHVHLRPFERLGKIDVWDDTRITPGSAWKDEIKKSLDSAKVIVLLVSADFLASDFISENELPPILLSASKDVIILPLIVSHSMFRETELSQFQTVNDPSKPLDSVPKAQQELVFVRVAQAIERALSS